VPAQLGAVGLVVPGDKGGEGRRGARERFVLQVAQLEEVLDAVLEVSTEPYIMVADERKPTRCATRMQSSHSSAVSL
jgi:hypothetical protein